jgi:hypothetical protein
MLSRRLCEFDITHARYVANAERAQSATDPRSTELDYEQRHAQLLWGKTGILGSPLT